MILPSDDSQRAFARIAGAAFLANYITGIAGYAALSTVQRSGGLAERAATLAGAEPLFRAGMASMAVSWVFLSLQAYALYVTLKPVSAHVARFGGILQGTQAAVGAASVMFGFAILRVYASVQPGTGSTHEPLQLVLGVVTSAYDSGFNVAMLFFAPASLLFFHLFYRSGYLPRALAALGIAGSALMIPASLAALVELPAAKAITLAAWTPMGIAEVGTALWLTLKGIRTPT
jgi:hypothetical protein